MELSNKYLWFSELSLLPSLTIFNFIMYAFPKEPGCLERYSMGVNLSINSSNL